MKRILAIVCILLMLLSFAACKDTGKNPSGDVSSEGHYITITIDSKPYNVHVKGTASLQDWYDEYGKKDGWVLKDGQIYTADESKKLDMAGMTINQDGLWSGQSFGLIDVDVLSSEEESNEVNPEELNMVPELNSVPNIPSFAKTGIGKEVYCYKIENPNYACSFNIEFQCVTKELLKKYLEFLDSNDPETGEKVSDSEYFYEWDWGSMSIYYHKNDEAMSIVMGAKR